MLNIRSSVQVKLVTVLNVEHEVSSVQILHYEEEVLLDVEMLELGQMSPHGSQVSQTGSYLGLKGAVKVRQKRAVPG